MATGMKDVLNRIEESFLDCDDEMEHICAVCDTCLLAYTCHDYTSNHQKSAGCADFIPKGWQNAIYVAKDKEWWST